MMRRLPSLFLIERDATLWKRQNSDYQEVFIGTAAREALFMFCDVSSATQLF
jgi:hypothetical protein